MFSVFYCFVYLFNMKTKTRGITIRRTIEVETPQKDGKTKIEKVKKYFPCRVNASVPFDHRMCENNG